MKPQLLQIKVDPALKEKLQRIALSKGLNVTSYIKMTLIEAGQADEEQALTENGFTIKEEKRLAASFVEAKKMSKAGKLKRYNSTEDFLNALNQ